MLVSRRGAEMDVPVMRFIIFLSRPRADEQSPQTAAGFHRRHAGWQILQRLRPDSALLHWLPAEPAASRHVCRGLFSDKRSADWRTASRCDVFSSSSLRSDDPPHLSWAKSHFHWPENVSEPDPDVEHKAFTPCNMNRCSFLNQCVLMQTRVNSRFKPGRHVWRASLDLPGLVLFCTYTDCFASVRQT